MSFIRKWKLLIIAPQVREPQVGKESAPHRKSSFFSAASGSLGVTVE